jgi:cytochrome o ubiquinol oxidase subunit 3
MTSTTTNSHALDPHTHEHANDHHHDTDAIDVFGFWLYILSDCILFATLFAGYAVLHNNTYGGPSLKELVRMGLRCWRFIKTQKGGH